jgi:hypothetical protein
MIAHPSVAETVASSYDNGKLDSMSSWKG